MSDNWRWLLVDPATSDSWRFPMNPNQMTSPNPPKNFTVFARGKRFDGTTMRDGVARVLRRRSEPYEWSFQGKIRTKEHLDTLKAWVEQTSLVQLTDHLQRTWLVRFTNIEVDEQRPTQRTAYRYTYTVKAIIYDRIS